MLRSRLPDTLGVIVATGAIVGVLGLSLLVGPRPTGIDDATAAATPAPEAAGPDTTAPPEASETPPAASDEGDPDDRVVPEAPAGPAEPLHVRIGTIGVDAPIVPVGLEDDGAMEIPEQVAEIGWYDPDGIGVVPGTQGTAVLAGHVDSRSQGRGALYDLRDLGVGETIELDLADGTSQRWLITEVIQYPKDVLPLEEIFTWAGPSRLAVITCGGEFDRTARSYTDNLVVYAEPLPDSPDA